MLNIRQGVEIMFVGLILFFLALASFVCSLASLYWTRPADRDGSA